MFVRAPTFYVGACIFGLRIFLERRHFAIDADILGRRHFAIGADILGRQHFAMDADILHRAPTFCMGRRHFA